MFTTFFQYKLVDQGKWLIKISIWFPSTKTCPCCGHANDCLSLAQPTYSYNCGFTCDKD
ncbi:transposase [Planococcus antarcticus]|uniref:transposase n=1 Tax=Planococcus antarcticus TaxID=161360 RepID=UPI001EE63F60|nr:transposase [Planococcus antarcticus]